VDVKSWLHDPLLGRMPEHLKRAASSADSRALKKRPRTPWNEQAKRLFKAEMARHGVTYKALARLLETEGGTDSAESLMTRINRGTFSVAFFLQALRAMGTKTVDISHIPRKL
jgi:hypothetical protein